MNRLLPEIPDVAAANDANVAALGELWQGGGKGKNSAVVFTLGTGVGGGVVIGGKIIAGANGGGGEVGHITVEPSETVSCNCGKCGCLEQYASANGIVRMAKKMLAECYVPSALRDMERFTSKDICDLARDGEEMAYSIIDRCCEYLGRAMSFVACTVDPDVFIIGGGMSYTFRKALGGNIGRSLLEADKIDTATELIAKAKERGVALMLPAFVFDGENNTEITLAGKKLSISYMGAECEYAASADIFETEKLGRNRNGYYKAYYTAAEKELTVKIKIN
jgi:predicted NBD/HSP70 family sugar kinase